MRRYAPGVAPTISSFRTSKRITNSGWVRTRLRTSGRLSFRLVDMTVASPHRRMAIAFSLVRKTIAKHRQAADRRRARNLVLNDIPVFREPAVLEADNVQNDPVRGGAVTGEAAMQH